MTPYRIPGGAVPTYRLRPGRAPQRPYYARLRALLAIGGAVTLTVASTLAATGGLSVLQGSDKPAAEDWRVQETPNLQASQRLLEVIGAPRGDAPLARAVTLAESVTNEQALLGGASVSAPVGLPSHPTPSAALAELLARHGVVPSADEQRAIDDLDRLVDPLAPALTRTINAYLGFEDATFDAFAFANIAYLRAAADADPPPTDGRPPASTATGTPPLATLRNAGIDVGPPMAARSALLEAALYLQYARLVTSPGARSDDPSTPAARASGATQTGAAPSGVACPAEPAIAIPPVVAIDVEGGDNCYAQDYGLVIDVDGADTYQANAGNVLIDVGGDDDQHLARNGGANGGAGFLVDDGGNDTYVGASGGTNGGASTGIGFLLDAGEGNDTYRAGGDATNGGALSGAGALVDDGGNDIYEAGDNGTNGGASISLGLPASGFLVDAGGNDVYRGGRKATNGAADSGSLGYLLDAGSGRDSYTAEGGTSNGSGLFAIGFLYDMGGGGDSYVVNGPPGEFSNGTGGATGHANTGGPSPAPGAGLLLDGGGINDIYRDGDSDASGTDVTLIPKGPVGAQVDRCSPARADDGLTGQACNR